MEISIKHSRNLSEQEIYVINELAARGFGEVNAARMLPDTQAHLNEADLIQLAYSDEHL